MGVVTVHECVPLITASNTKTLINTRVIEERDPY